LETPIDILPYTPNLLPLPLPLPYMQRGQAASTAEALFSGRGGGVFGPAHFW